MNGAETKTEVKKLNRYPGLRPFIKDDSSLFFGRNTEILQLVDSIKVNKTLVLFGKSGLGKSSLIQAGVSPKLVDAGFLPLTVRFLDQKQDPLVVITGQMASQLRKNNLHAVETGNDLVRLFKEWQSPQKPVLVFDQFEEFFYYPPEKRQRTIAALASLLNQSFTVAVTGRDSAGMEDNSHPERTVKIDVSPKMLFLIRSDRYNMMNELADKIPGLFNNRFELKPLLKPKAEQSIVLPAQIGRPADANFAFKVSPYRYSLEALHIILKSLSKGGEEIESSQLQILCQELEEIAERDFEGPAAEPRLIEPTHFKNESGIKEILNRFYWKQLEKLKNDSDLALSDEDVRFVRTLIENELVKGGKRVVQSAEAVREFLENVKPGVVSIGDKTKVDAVIDKLLDLRLIREEESNRGKVYEITHDTLLESIIKLRDDRAKQEKDQKIQEQEALLNREKRRADEANSLKDKARADRESAMQAQREADEARKKALTAETKAKEALAMSIESQKEAEQAQVDMKVALDMAIIQEKNANQSRQEALRSRAKAKRSLAFATVGFLLVLIFAVVVVFLLHSSKHDKDKLNQIYGQVLLLNSTRAYDDENHALAFNLANTADAVLDRKGRLVDSLVSKWDLSEYSGLQVQVNADRSMVACQYKNRMMQLFRITDTLRKNNKSLLINDADNFKISEDGTALAVVDTVNHRFRFYKLSAPESSGLDTTRIWAPALSRNYEINTDESFLTRNYFAFVTEDTLRVYFFSSQAVSYRPYKKGVNYGTYCNNHSIFLAGNERKTDTYFIDEIGLKPDGLVVKRRPGSYFVRNNSQLPLFFDEKTKFVFKILPDSIAAVFKLSRLSPHFYLQGLGIYDDGYLALGGDGTTSGMQYFHLPMADKSQAMDSLILLNQKSFIRDDLGEMVYNAHEFPLFVKDDTLLTLSSGAPVRTRKITGLDSAYFRNSGNYIQYSLSADKKRIYAVGSLGEGSKVIDLASLSTLAINSKSSLYSVQKVGGSDFYYSSNGLRSLRTDGSVGDYWKGFYEPLDTFSKKVYGIQ